VQWDVIKNAFQSLAMFWPLLKNLICCLLLLPWDAARRRGRGQAQALVCRGPGGAWQDWMATGFCLGAPLPGRAEGETPSGKTTIPNQKKKTHAQKEQRLWIRGIRLCEPNIKVVTS
jgi:hypothetical protein